MGKRITLYFRPEHQALLRWAIRHTGASSLSEAVARALAELQTLRVEAPARALEAAHGVWADDPAVDLALEELREGWRTWQTADF